MKKIFRLYTLLLIATLIALCGCHRSGLTRDQQRFQRIAQNAYRDTMPETTGHHFLRLVLTVELDAGCKIITQQTIDSHTNEMSFITTERCILASRVEEPNRHRPGGPLFGEVAIIPVTNLNKRITIWADNNIWLPLVYDSSGNDITGKLIAF